MGRATTPPHGRADRRLLSASEFLDAARSLRADDAGRARTTQAGTTRAGHGGGTDEHEGACGGPDWRTYATPTREDGGGGRDRRGRGPDRRGDRGDEAR